MSQPVWVLSVDLQTKTATFQSGMADAAKSARGAFTDIKSGSSSMSSHVGGNMFATRHAVMAVSEAFGTHLPRAITAFVAHIGPLGAILEAAFPFAAIGLGAVLLIEHLAKLEEASEKLTADQVHFGTAVANAYNMLEQKMLQAEIRADELRNDHLGALHHQLELIDNQSMSELVKSFAEVDKAADAVLGDLKAGWYEFGTGATGAKHALSSFKDQYDSLLAQNKGGQASDLLRGTRESAERILALQKQAKDNEQAGADSEGNTGPGDELKFREAVVALKQAGSGYTTKEVQAQQTLVDALHDQEGIQTRIAALTKLEEGNAIKTTGNALASKSAEGARQAAEHRRKMGELSVAAERDEARITLAIKEASIAERLASDLRLEDEEYAIQLRGAHELAAALDKSGKDYQNQLRAAQDKTLELTAQHENKLASLRGKAQEESYKKEITDLEQSIREAIQATSRGEDERLAAIDAAIKKEQSLGRQNSTFYRELLTQRVETVRQITDEADKLQAEAGKEAAENIKKMGELSLAADKEALLLQQSGRRVLIGERIADELRAAQAEFDVKREAMQQEQAALDSGSKDYTNKLQALQDKETQLIRAHENQVTQIQDQAAIDRNQKILAASQRFNADISAGLTQTLMGHQTFASMMNSLGNQVVGGLIQNALESILANDMTKESDAAAAARRAFNAGMKLPFPANIVAAPVLGAAAFASVMAFQEGTDSVPGIGRGDKVPAMLEPGEGVVPGGVMDGLRTMAQGGRGFGGGTTVHVHHSPTYNVQTIDGDGVRGMLTKHKDEFSKHVKSEMRRMNQ